MQKAKLALLGAVASLALLAGGAAQAQSRTARQVIEVPPGAVVLVLPGGAMRAVPMAAMPMDAPGFDAPFPIDMIRQMRQMDQMMADAQRAFAAPVWTDPQRMIEAAMGGMPQPGNGVQGVVVTSYFDGQHSCTRRVTYSGNGAAPKIEVSAAGCGGATPAPGIPAATPYIAPAQPALPHTLLVKNRTRTPGAAPIQVAEAN